MFATPLVPFFPEAFFFFFPPYQGRFSSLRQFAIFRLIRPAAGSPFRSSDFFPILFPNSGALSLPGATFFYVRSFPPGGLRELIFIPRLPSPFPYFQGRRNGVPKPFPVTPGSLLRGRPKSLRHYILPFFPSPFLNSDIRCRCLAHTPSGDGPDFLATLFPSPPTRQFYVHEPLLNCRQIPSGARSRSFFIPMTPCVLFPYAWSARTLQRFSLSLEGNPSNFSFISFVEFSPARRTRLALSGPSLTLFPSGCSFSFPDSACHSRNPIRGQS